MTFPGKIKLKKLFWSRFPQNSKTDRAIRSIYHSIYATRLYVSYKILKANLSYKRWKNEQDDFLSSLAIQDCKTNYLTFLLPLEEVETSISIETVKSILNQGNPNWRLLIFDKSNNQFIWPDEQILQDSRIEIVSLKKASLIEMNKFVSSKFVVLAFPGDVFSPFFVNLFIHSFLQHPDGTLFYPDVEIFCPSQKKYYPFFKPDKTSPDLMLSVNYLSRSPFMSAEVWKLTKIPSMDHSLVNQEWMVMRELFATDAKLIHIPYQLITIYEPSFPDTKNYENMDNNSEISSISEEEYSSISKNFSFNHPLANPFVSIIIPSSNNYPTLDRLLRSLLDLTASPPFEIIIVEDGKSDITTKDYISQFETNRKFTFVANPQTFNYSQANNLGASRSKGTHLLFLNDDMEIIRKDWLLDLVRALKNPEIAIAGAKLLFPNHTIQHAGIVIGMQGIGGHLYQHAPRNYFGLAGSVNWHRNVSAVTGACQIMRHEVYEELNGFDEQFTLTFSDIDICLRAREKGYKILYVPTVEIIHHQGYSRGFYTPDEDINLAREKFSKELDEIDPYFNKNLVAQPIPFCRKFISSD